MRNIIKSSLLIVAAVLFTIPLFAASKKTKGLTPGIDAPDFAYVGQQVRIEVFMLTDQAAGTVSPVNAVVTLPAGVTYVSSTENQGTSSFSSPNVTFNAGSASGSIGGLVGSITVNVTTPGTKVITVNFDVAGTPITGSATMQVLTSGLVVSKIDLPEHLTSGNPVAYTITIENSGPGNAINAVVTDEFSSLLTVSTVTAPPGWTTSGAGNQRTFTNPSFAPGAATFTISGSTSATTTGMLSNCVRARSDNYAEVYDTNITVVQPSSPTANPAVLSIIGGRFNAPNNPTTAFQGSQYRYNVDPDFNTGTTIAPATITVTLDPQLSYVGENHSNPNITSVTHDGSPSGGVVTIQISSMNSVGTISGSYAVSINTNVSPTATEFLHTTAELTGTKTAPTPAAPALAQSDFVSNLLPYVNYTVNKTISPNPSPAGSTATYTVTVSTDRPVIGGVVLTDVVPLGLDPQNLTGISPAGWTFNTFGGGPFFAAGNNNFTQTGSFSFDIDIPANTCTPTITDVGQVQVTYSAPTSTNFEVTTPLDVDLVVTATKTASPDPIVPGNQLTYTLNFDNTGSCNLNNASFVDNLPPQIVSIDSVTQTGSGPTFTISTTPTSVSGTAGAFNAGTSKTITIVVNTDPAYCGSLTNSGTFSSTSPAAISIPFTTTTPTDGNISATAVKVASPDPVLPGNPVTYTLTFANNGSCTLDDASFTDTLPTDILGLVAAPTQSGSGPVFNITTTPTTISGTATSAFLPGTSRIITFQVNTDPTYCGPLTNSGTFVSTSPESLSIPFTVTSNQLSSSTSLAATLTVDDPEVMEGDLVTYTGTITNISTCINLGVSFIDVLPAGLLFESISSNEPSFVFTTPTVGTNGTITGTAPQINPGQTITFTIVARVAPGAPSIMNNSITVTTATPPFSVTASATIRVTSAYVEFLIEKFCPFA